MKKIIAVCLMVFLLFLTSCNDAQTLDDSSADVRDLHIEDYLALDTSGMEFVESMENVDGELVDIYTDGEYNYSVLRSTGTLISLFGNDSLHDALLKKYNDDPDYIIERGQADRLLEQVISEYFPEYNWDTLKIECNDETGSYIESYIFMVYDYDGINRVNKASVSFAFDGTLTMLSGTHISSDIFEGTDTFSESELVEIAFNYVRDHKDELAAESIGTGDFFDESGTQLPSFAYIVESPEDLKNMAIEKMVYRNTVCWNVSFDLGNTWSELDGFYEVMNPYITLYIDARDGTVVEHLSTASFMAE